MLYQQKLWSVDMPDGWTYDEGDSCVGFFDPEGVGALHISVHCKEELVTDADLRDLAEEGKLQSTRLGNAEGFFRQAIDGDTFWIKWWVRYDKTMLFITYNCSAQEQGTEEAELGHLLASIEIK